MSNKNNMKFWASYKLTKKGVLLQKDGTVLTFKEFLDLFGDYEQEYEAFLDSLNYNEVETNQEFYKVINFWFTDFDFSSDDELHEFLFNRVKQFVKAEYLEDLTTEQLSDLHSKIVDRALFVLSYPDTEEAFKKLVK